MGHEAGLEASRLSHHGKRDSVSPNPSLHRHVLTLPLHGGLLKGAPERRLLGPWAASQVHTSKPFSRTAGDGIQGGCRAALAQRAELKGQVCWVGKAQSPSFLWLFMRDYIKNGLNIKCYIYSKKIWKDNKIARAYEASLALQYKQTRNCGNC